jgi:hypothetical protein
MFGGKTLPALLALSERFLSLPLSLTHIHPVATSHPLLQARDAGFTRLRQILCCP